MERKYKIILSGGGTGGHIYPAVAVAEALERRLGDRVGLLFVGAEGKMEMEKVPSLGYDIVGLPIAGMQRRLDVKNFSVPFRVVKCVNRAGKVIHDFGADVVAGFGGYASGPVLWAAQRMHLPNLIQEQNSYAGLTNKILGRRADRICVAYDHMEKFFPASRIVMTGNPLRGKFSGGEDKKAEALEYFGLDKDKPVLLILGGSLGTRTLNDMMKGWVDDIVASGDMQVIWQNGKFYDAEMQEFMAGRLSTGIWRGAFIDRMDLAYAAADVVVSRSGAITVSELCLVGKPVIFVPSPNVAEDHQTKNAMALVRENAALMVSDDQACQRVIPRVRGLLADRGLRSDLARNIHALAVDDSADRIAAMIIELADICALRRKLGKIDGDE